MSTLLLVEDDRTLGETLEERLQKEGYQVAWVDRAIRAKAEMDRTHFDLIILDVGLPDGNGFEIARTVKAGGGVNAKTPILFLTAMSSAEYRLEGYEAGAEEYIPKPFHLRELLLRIRHVLESHVIDEVTVLGDCTVRWRAYELVRGEIIERLQPRDAALLKVLVARSPSVVSRDDVLNQIWGEDKFPTTRTVDNAVVRLRHVLGEKQSSRLRSVRGVGYQWE